MTRATLPLIALVTLGANLLLHVAWVWAVVAALAVLAIGEALGRALPANATSAQPGTSAGDERPAPGLGAGHPLTRREAEVAILVAQGLRNKEIASRLFISERTVDNHIQHSFNRLNLSSRVELATWVHEHGLQHKMSTGIE